METAFWNEATVGIPKGTHYTPEQKAAIAASRAQTQAHLKALVEKGFDLADARQMLGLVPVPQHGGGRPGPRKALINRKSARMADLLQGMGYEQGSCPAGYVDVGDSTSPVWNGSEWVKGQGEVCQKVTPGTFVGPGKTYNRTSRKGNEYSVTAKRYSNPPGSRKIVRTAAGFAEAWDGMPGTLYTGTTGNLKESASNPWTWGLVALGAATAALLTAWSTGAFKKRAKA